MIVEGLEQGSELWHKFRKRHIMASYGPILMKASKWSTPYDLFCEITGLTPPRETNGAMQRGLDMEPVARAEFTKLTGIEVVPVVMQSDKHQFMAASLDGWDEASKTLVEIKCPGLDDHRSARQGIVPIHYLPQLVHQMIVAYVEKGYYFSYRPGDVQKEAVLIEVKLDPEYAALLIDVEKDFYRRLQEGDCPER